MTKLDHLRMLKEIDSLVSNDFCFEMDCLANLPKQRQIKQSEARQMVKIIGLIYQIAHCIHCEACQGRYKLQNIK